MIILSHQWIILSLPPLCSRLRIEEPLVLHLHHPGSLPLIIKIFNSQRSPSRWSHLPRSHLLQPICVGSLPGRLTRVVVDVVNPATRVPPHLPTRGKRLWSLPGCRAGVVVDVVAAAVLIISHLPPRRQRLLRRGRSCCSCRRSTTAGSTTCRWTHTCPIGQALPCVF